MRSYLYLVELDRKFHLELQTLKEKYKGYVGSKKEESQVKLIHE